MTTKNMELIRTGTDNAYNKQKHKETRQDAISKRESRGKRNLRNIKNTVE